MQPGRKLKREWAASHNASAPSTQDREVAPLHALPGPSGTQVQSEFGNVSIFTSTFYLVIEISTYFFQLF
jgi:hypothetical protein